jgi:leader peptidase (prepilin peptidase)/N-methyltransferase
MTVFDAVALGFALLPIAYLLAVAWPLARTDLREHRLPNALTLPGLWLALAAQTLASATLGFGEIARGASPWPGFANQAGALAAAALVFGSGLAAHVWLRLGMGDVKLLTVMSLSLGWFSPWSPLLALFVGFAVAVVVVVAGLLAGRTKLNAAVALGPYLLVGFAVAALVLVADASKVYSPGEVIDSTSRALSS